MSALVLPLPPRLRNKMRLPYPLRIDLSQVVSIYLDTSVARGGRTARGDGKDENERESFPSFLLSITHGAPLDRENDSTVGCMTSKNWCRLLS